MKKKVTHLLLLGTLILTGGCLDQNNNKTELSLETVSMQNQNFINTSKTSLDSLKFTKSYDKIYFRGTPNNFGNSEMHLIANNLWSITVSFGNKSNERFKFDVYGNWSFNFGDNNKDGTADKNGCDIKGLIGKKCDITFNDVSKKYTIKESEQVYDKVYLRGTFNNWQNLEMNYIGNSCWKSTVSFNNSGRERFKFDIFQDWSFNFGDNNKDGICERNGSDIFVLPGKTYDIIFNAKLNSYTVKEVNSKIVFSENFETGIDGWTTSSFTTDYTITHEKNIGINNSSCVSIKAKNPNDVALYKKLNLTSEKIYKMSAYIKGENLIYKESKCVGANICLRNVTFQNSQYSCTESNYNWQKVEIFFVVPSSGEVEIGLRLGFINNTVSGNVYFDNITVEEVDENSGANIKIGKNIGVIFNNEDTTTISDSKFDKWVSNLNSVYDSYLDLVGEKPFNGEKIYILPTNFQWGAIAGNPILTNKFYIKDNLKKINDVDDWSFGYLHEIGHVFDIDNKWNFDAEFWANFKMIYALETLNGTICMTNNSGQNVFYKGKEICKYYQIDSPDSYTNTPEGIYSGDWLTAKFIDIKDKIGWDVFKVTFREFNKMNENEVPLNRIDKFNLFINKLEKNSNYKFEKYDIFNAIDLETIYTQYK